MNIRSRFSRLRRSGVLAAALALSLAPGLIAPGSVSAQPVDLTLEQMVDRALEYNERSRSATLEVTRAQAAERSALLERLPSLALSAGYERVRDLDPPSLSLPDPPGGEQTLGESVPDRISFQARLRQEIFSGFARSAQIAEREALRSAASLRANHTKEQLELEASERFFAGVLADRSVGVAERALDRAREGRREREELLEEGLATRNEVLRARMAEVEAASELQRAENERRRALLQIARMLGISGAQNINLVHETDLDASRSAVDPEHDLSLAAERRSDLAAAGRQIDAAGERIRQARAPLYPRVSLGAGVVHARPNPAVFPAQAEFETTWSVGLEIAFDVGAIPLVRSRAEQARIARESAELEYERRRNDLSLEVRERALDLRDANERVESARIMLEQSRENVRVSGELHEEGLMRLSELLEAQELADRAELLLLEARIGRRLAEGRYAFATGGTDGSGGFGGPGATDATDDIGGSRATRAGRDE